MFDGFVTAWRHARKRADAEAVTTAIREIPDVRLVTPECTIQYAYLRRPDTKFDADGVYRVDATAEKNKEWQGVLDATAKLQRVCEAAVKAAGASVRPAEFGPFEEEDDGTISLRAKRKAKTLKGKVIPPPIVVDATGQHISESPWGGSRAKLAVVLRAYYSPTIGCGVTAYLQAVQVTHLVTGGDSWDPFGAESVPDSAPDSTGEGDNEEIPF